MACSLHGGLGGNMGLVIYHYCWVVLGLGAVVVCDMGDGDCHGVSLACALSRNGNLWMGGLSGPFSCLGSGALDACVLDTLAGKSCSKLNP